MTTEQSPDIRKWVIRKALLGIGVVLIFVWISSILQKGPLDAGTPAPEIHLPLATGPTDTFRLSEHIGQVVLLDFWSTTCPGCIRQIPELLGLYQDYAAQGLVLIGVTAGGETLSRLTEFATGRQIPWPVAGDLRGTAVTAYHVRSLPTLFLIGKDGRIAARFTGHHRPAGLRSAIEEALSR